MEQVRGVNLRISLDRPRIEMIPAILNLPLVAIILVLIFGYSSYWSMINEEANQIFGADGIDFDERGTLYVANCGDAVIEKIVPDKAGKAVRQEVLTAPGRMKSADGIFYDRQTRRIYVADILANAVRAVTLDGRVETVAQNGDSDGSGGQLDGPSEAVARGQELIVANFDRVFPRCVNTKPDKPYTLAVIRKPRP